MAILAPRVSVTGDCTRSSAFFRYRESPRAPATLSSRPKCQLSPPTYCECRQNRRNQAALQDPGLDRLRIVHRDVSAKVEGKARGYDQHLEALITDLESKNIYLEDIDESVMNKLRELLVVREPGSGESDA